MVYTVKTFTQELYTYFRKLNSLTGYAGIVVGMINLET